MKTALLSFIALMIWTISMPVNANGQIVIEPSNFYWQKIVQYEGTVTDIHDQIIKSGVFSSIISDSGNYIIGNIDNISLKYSNMSPRPIFANKPLYWREGERYSGNLSYEIKEGRYRVIFKDIVYHTNDRITISGIEVSMDNTPVNIAFYKKDGRFFRGDSAQKFAQSIFDFTFSNAFIIKIDQNNNSDW